MQRFGRAILPEAEPRHAEFSQSALESAVENLYGKTPFEHPLRSLQFAPLEKRHSPLHRGTRLHHPIAALEADHYGLPECAVGSLAVAGDILEDSQTGQYLGLVGRIPAARLGEGALRQMNGLPGVSLLRVDGGNIHQRAVALVKISNLFCYLHGLLVVGQSRPIGMHNVLACPKIVKEDQGLRSITDLARQVQACPELLLCL
ncbi:MAG: hypothetical protein MUC42_00450 [Bryobacter sp.]|nr:hypothetical protein [Bryobacter sp.]